MRESGIDRTSVTLTFLLYLRDDDHTYRVFRFHAEDFFLLRNDGRLNDILGKDDGPDIDCRQIGLICLFLLRSYVNGK